MHPVHLGELDDAREVPQPGFDPLSIVTSDFAPMDGRRVVSVPVTVEVPAGGLLIVAGDHRSGKTSLLLALTGRFARMQGSAKVLGLDPSKRASRVRARCAFAGAAVNPLDQDLRVYRQVAAQVALHSPWWRPWLGRKARRRAVIQLADLLTEIRIASLAMVPHAAPRPTSLVEPMRHHVDELTPYDQWLLTLGLALIDSSELIAVDDVDALRDPVDRQLAWASLMAATDSIARTTIVASCHSATEPEELRWAQRSPESVRPVICVYLDAARSDERAIELEEK